MDQEQPKSRPVCPVGGFIISGYNQKSTTVPVLGRGASKATETCLVNAPGQANHVTSASSKAGERRTVQDSPSTSKKLPKKGKNSVPLSQRPSTSKKAKTMMMMKITQVNLHHSKAASAALLLRMAERGEDLVLIQEPWINRDRICGLTIRGYKLMHVNNTGKPRACILAKTSLNIFILPDYSDEDTITSAWETTTGTILVSSCYMGHDHVSPPPNDLVRKAADLANQQNLPLIIGADANAHHVIWGSSDTNTRGESIFDFILCNNLEVANSGSEPTFVVANRQEVLDITIVSTMFSALIKNWKVSSDCSFSDHRYIEFEIITQREKATPYRNRRKTDWDTHKTSLDRLLPPLPNINNRDDIDHAVNVLTDALDQATNLACRFTIRRGKKKPPWWSSDIATLRKECRRLFNEAKRTTNWHAYKASVNRFKNLVRNAKKQSWRNFCSGVEGSSDTSRLRKILTKSPSVAAYIQKDSGQWTTSGSETLEVLLGTHFPGCMPLNVRTPYNQSVFESNPIPLNRERIKWAIDSFDPYKSAGPDGIIPADLQHNADILIPWLILIYDGCLRLSHIPETWTRCNVVFIPKAGKATHTKPKDFRPISLCSFLLKTLERLIDAHLRASIDPTLLSSSQHAYNKGKSVETALHSLVSHIEKSLEFGEFTLAAFLDIEGAFNNIKPESIISAMEDLGVDNLIISFIDKLLTHRVISSTMGTATVHKVACRGTPQGGVLSPLLWNLAINKLLTELDSLRFNTIAYADDVAITVSGKFPNTLSQRLETALDTLYHWSTSNGLGVNANKTELVLFSRKYKIPTFILPRLNNEELVLTDHAKYLGVILDSKLSWSLNTQFRVSKASIALYSCRGAIGKTWGLNPTNTAWLFDMVVKPILMYGALVWWPSLTKANQRNSFIKILRSSALMITGALRTTPSKALFVMLNWLPVELMAQQAALNSAIRLSTIGTWSRSSTGHSAILDKIDNIPDLIDYCTPTPLFDKPFTVTISRDPSPLDDGCLEVYTDGSKSNKGVGGGFVIPTLGKEICFKLPDLCSVLQAEISAIYRAANWLRYHRIYNRDIRFCIDSQAAIKSLSNVHTTSVLTRECRASLNEMARHCNTELFWVPGHNSIPGNSTADKLAKTGALLGQEHVDQFTGLPLSACKSIVRQNFYRSAQNIWSTETTCSISRQTWPTYNSKRSKCLVSLPRHRLRNLISILTGHCVFGLHASRLNLQHYDYCRSCHDIEEEETVTHLLCHCPALSNSRAFNLGAPSLHDLSDLASIDIRKIDSFINATGWLG